MKSKTKFLRIFVFIIAALLIFCACSPGDTEPNENVNPGGVTDSTDNSNDSSAEPTTEPTEEPTIEPTAEPQNNDSNEPAKIIQDFLNAINEKSSEDFKQIVSPSGLVVIRNFSSGNGARGKDIRNLYKVEEIPSNLEFEVSGEIPIALNGYFLESRQMDIRNIPMQSIDYVNFNFLDSKESGVYGPPTDAVRDICSELASDNEGQYKPKLYMLGETEIVLTESASADGIPDGIWSVFESADSSFFLRAIIDLR